MECDGANAVGKLKEVQHRLTEDPYVGSDTRRPSPSKFQPVGKKPKEVSHTLT